jgi:hypothetical protein
MDIARALTEALKALEAANVPDDLREKAFEKAFELAARDLEPDSPSTVEQQRLQGGDPGLGEAGLEIPAQLARIAERLRLALPVVGDVFYEDNGEVGIGLPASSLDRSKSGATRQLALLVAAARQGAGLEEWTSSSTIRAICADYGRFDSANFASTLKNMGSLFSYRGKGHGLEVRLTRPGLEQAADLIQEMGNGG